MPIPADPQRITWDLSRILLPLSLAKRYGGLAAAALAATAVFFLFSRAGGNNPGRPALWTPLVSLADLGVPTGLESLR